MAVALVLPLPYSDKAAGMMQQWLGGEVELLVPALWSYEVVSALRKAVVLQVISADTAMTVLHDLLTIGIREVAPTLTLQRKALEWADRLNHTVAYDATYLALAEDEEAEFWTADRQLADAAVQAGASRVQHL